MYHMDLLQHTQQYNKAASEKLLMKNLIHSLHKMTTASNWRLCSLVKLNDKSLRDVQQNDALAFDWAIDTLAAPRHQIDITFHIDDVVG